MRFHHAKYSMPRREIGECTGVTPASVSRLARCTTALLRLEVYRNPRRWNPWLDALIDRNATALRRVIGRTEPW